LLDSNATSRKTPTNAITPRRISNQDMPDLLFITEICPTPSQSTIQITTNTISPSVIQITEQHKMNSLDHIA
jgi:hypothetical protein